MSSRRRESADTEGPGQAHTIDALLAGIAWPSRPDWPYPRLSERAATHVPEDTREAATVPAGLHIAGLTSGGTIEVDHRVKRPPPLYEWARPELAMWRGDELVATQAVDGREGRATFDVPDGPDPVRIYLPAQLKPLVTGIRGSLEPLAPLPRWVAYGDSITAGWSTGVPGSDWVSRTARRLGLDVVNLGFAGAARGELAVADDIAALPADVITVAFGTNCWVHRPHTADQLEATAREFLARVRRGHPTTPLIVLTPLARPDSEGKPSPVGATLEDLRDALRRAAAATEPPVHLVEGRDLVAESDLVDGIHPGERGHRKLAERLTDVLAEAVGTGVT